MLRLVSAFSSSQQTAIDSSVKHTDRNSGLVQYQTDGWWCHPGSSSSRPISSVASTHNSVCTCALMRHYNISFLFFLFPSNSDCPTPFSSYSFLFSLFFFSLPFLQSLYLLLSICPFPLVLFPFFAFLVSFPRLFFNILFLILCCSLTDSSCFFFY